MATTPFETDPEGCVMTVRAFLRHCAAGLAHHKISSKKVAVLTGLTMLVCGAGIVSANADTTTPELLNVNTFDHGGLPNTVDQTLNFTQFNLPGTLTGVTFNLISSINFDGLQSVTAAVTVNGTQLFSITNASGPSPVPFSPTPPVSLDSTLSFFIGPPPNNTFPVNLFIDTNCGSACTGGWVGTLSVAYTFDPPSVGVPGPIVGAGLPGLLGMLGFGGWKWRRRKKIS